MSHQLHELHKLDGVVVSDPNILGGTLVFAGTRVPVKSLFDYLSDHLSVEYFLKSFPSVTREQVMCVLKEAGK